MAKRNQKMDQKEQEFRKVFCEQFNTNMICGKCLNNPKYTYFDASALVSYCEHTRSGLCLSLIDFVPSPPVHILYPLTHLEFLSCLTMLGKFSQWVKGIQAEYQKKVNGALENLSEESMAKS